MKMKKKKSRILISEDIQKLMLKMNSDEEAIKIATLKGLLARLPYCEFEPDLCFIQDNLNEMSEELAMSIRSTCHKIIRNDWHYISLYFYFFNTGRFKVIKDNSFTLPNKLAAKVFESHGKDQASSWSEGFEAVVKILNEAYS